MAVSVFDLDKTLTRYDTYIHFLLLVIALHPDRLARVLQLPREVIAYKRGQINNTQLKISFLEAICQHLPRQAMEQAAARFADTIMARGLRPGGRRALASASQNGLRIVLASASLSIYVHPIADRLGIEPEDVISTDIGWDAADRVSGKLEGPNKYGAAKLDSVLEWCQKTGSECIDIAFSDHESDLPLLLHARRGIVVNPTPCLRLKAHRLGLEMVQW